MEKIIIYKAFDGTVFENSNDCEKYEEDNSIIFYSSDGEIIHPEKCGFLPIAAIRILKMPQNYGIYCKYLRSLYDKALARGRSPDEQTLKALLGICESGMYYWCDILKMFLSENILQDINLEFENIKERF